VTTERVVEPGELLAEGPIQTVTISRLSTDAVAEVPGGAHFTSCTPDYERDEAFQKDYVSASADPGTWASFDARYLRVDEADYQAAVRQGASSRGS
jgi:glutaconate CoA-transferase subunit A